MTDPNPYQPSGSPAPDQKPEWSQRSGVGMSVFLILAGLFFCVASFYSLFNHGIGTFYNQYPFLERFPTWFMLFYGIVAGLTSAFHFSYLRRGRPSQSMAGIYALGIGFVLTCIAVAVLEFFRR